MLHIVTSETTLNFKNKKHLYLRWNPFRDFGIKTFRLYSSIHKIKGIHNRKVPEACCSIMQRLSHKDTTRVSVNWPFHLQLWRPMSVSRSECDSILCWCKLKLLLHATNYLDTKKTLELIVELFYSWHWLQIEVSGRLHSSVILFRGKKTLVRHG
jgi:hypothetical protein